MLDGVYSSGDSGIRTCNGARFLLPNTKQVQKYKIYIERYTFCVSLCGAVDRSPDSQWWGPGFKTTPGRSILSISTVVNKSKIYIYPMIYCIPQFKWRRGKTLSYGLMVPGSTPGSVTKYKLKKNTDFCHCRRQPTQQCVQCGV